MKNTISVIAFFVMMITGSFVSAQNAVEIKSEKVQIKTSAVCGMCKTTIETALFKVKGVKAAQLTVSTKMVEVIFDPRKVSLDEIRTAINMVGYDADEKPADPVAYENLHGCCKKDSHD